MGNSALCPQVEVLIYKDSLSYELCGDGPDQRHVLQDGAILQSSSCPFSWGVLIFTAVCYASECWLGLPELSFTYGTRRKLNRVSD